jgi:hypothetical protein
MVVVMVLHLKVLAVLVDVVVEVVVLAMVLLNLEVLQQDTLAQLNKDSLVVLDQQVKVDLV